MVAYSYIDSIADRSILIVGAPRSGTTWLAKIFDSHPEVIYRHEPDEMAPASGSIQENLAVWVRQHDARTAGKRPFFHKTWLAAPVGLLRTGLATAGAAANRLGFPAWPVPDLGDIGRARVVIKSVRLSTGIGDFARAYPAGRALLILRHPCGQAASVMRGASEGRFELAKPGTDMPFDEASAIAFTAPRGIAEAEFQRLPDAAKYAWSWRAFNETAWASIAGQGNAYTVIYEDLCANPHAAARAALEFAGLAWHNQTETFLARSTSYDGPVGYHAVVRNSIAAAGRWRTTMTQDDQGAVRAAVRGSPLTRLWPDLADSG